MTHIIVWTIPSEPNFFTIIVENKNDLAEAVERIAKNGKNAKIDIYEATKINYKLEYTEKEEKFIKQIPRITKL